MPLVLLIFLLATQCLANDTASQPLGDAESLGTAAPPQSSTSTPATATSDPATSSSGTPATPPAKKPPSKGKKATWSARVIRTQNPAQRIPELDVPETEAPVLLFPNKGRLRPLVEVRGHFNKPGWKLFADKVSLLGKFDDPTEFAVFLYLNAQSSEITLTAVGPKGETLNEELVLFAPEVQEFEIDSPWGQLALSSGIAYFTYFQTYFGDYRSFVGDFSARYTLAKPGFPIGLDTSLSTTYWTLASQPRDMSPQFIEGKVDAFYAFPPQPQQKWLKTAVVGFTYFSILSNGCPFGFANLLSPELGMKFDYPTSPRARFITELRFSSLGSGFDLSQRGINLNLLWAYRTQSLHHFDLGLRLTDIAFEPDPLAKIRARLLALTMSYSL